MVLVDSNVIIAGLNGTHPKHSACWNWLEAARRGEIRLACSQHAIAESYAIMTSLPPSFRLPGKAVSQLLDDLFGFCTPVALKPADYLEAASRLALAGLEGGVIYDMLHLMAAEKCSADRIVTDNSRDFQRLPTVRSIRIVGSDVQPGT